MNRAEKGSGNVCADLDHPIAKAQIVTAMIQAIEAKEMSLDHAARLIGMPLDELSEVMAGQFQERSLGELERIHKEIQQCTKT